MSGAPVEKALISMFGLEGRVITRMVITCEVGSPPTLQLTEIPEVGHPYVTSIYEIGAPVKKVTV